jgi:DNA (cytosine-5)-methyltransferase 1
VLSDLERGGYAAQPLVIPACAVDAPHRRDRVWIVANAHQVGREGRAPRQIFWQPNVQVESVRGPAAWPRGWDLSSPRTCGAADGIPARVDRLERLGNAVVPQVVEVIGRAIITAHEETHR